MDGILLINKPIGWTSRDVVNKLSKKFSIKKMGHTGTLDPFASGLMIVTVGKGTKISNHMENLDKEYIAELTLGQETDTLDLEGNVVATDEVKLPIDKNKMKESMCSFLGDIKQVPPMYSAIKINGEELYKKARRGEVIERKSRDVTINYIELLSITKNKIIFKTGCSKGTYIRVLGSDIAKKYGSLGYLSMLTRTKVGKYSINEAKTIEEVTEEDCIPIEDALSHMYKVIVDGENEKKVLNGVALKLSSNPLVVVCNKAGKALAIYQINEDGKHHCVRGLL